NTYVLANVLRDTLKKGDEIIVTNQDHEANSGVWRRLESAGVVVREWRVDPESGSLDTAQLENLLGEKTRYLMFPHCSNILGEINPLAKITAMARSAGALSIVDGVSFAGHGLPDVPSTGADIYLFSSYKTFGPHQGVMVIRPEVVARLGNQGHFFNAAFREKCLTPAGPDHAQVAALRGIADYFDAVYEFHRDASENLNKAAMLRQLFHEAENARLERLMGYLRDNKKLRIVGPADAEQRAPTVSVVPNNCSPLELVEKLARHGVMCGAGHFYSYRLMEALGIDPQRGVTRFSFVHYATDEEIDQLIEALEQEL
ncbi:MAG: aminotransferase class V-fold PLP-dependent enzyme, partial [Gammaproteobacteria bacterium]|nr:aminotransferase class V-fold PLP-dependent enzyme [Gammaproteobacteria bacterium]